ncbi:MAG: glycogen synthase [Candidatus Eisenbacteria bacterium]|uniref:Glycogen synthase n=1 Tax=Eiseniibacteriota bacterium TaxID=2212470 RepID=A0A956M0E2_UNCEI|nr:glycogen synthase [Candidatus Eisenbacteria bacterium]
MPHEIAIAATEMRPFCQVGDLGDFVESLARELRRRDHTVTVFLPRYPKVLAEVAQLPRRSASVQIPMGDSVETANLLMVEVPSTHVRIVWVGHPYFERPDPYVDPTTEQEWSDNADRWIFFAKAIVAGLEALELAPDLIHLNDHQTALVPLLLREGPDTPDRLRRLGCLFSIHEIGLQGIYGRDVLEQIGLPARLAAPLGPLEYFGRVNFMKAGIASADFITTVSPTHAQQIQSSAEIGAGLDGILRQRHAHLVGILHGIDAEEWNPSSDHHLPYRYGWQTLQGKVSDKIRLLESLQLPVEPDVPLIGMAAPVREDQGFELLDTIAGDLFGERLKLAVLGTGSPSSESVLERLRKAFPQKFAWVREPGVPQERLLYAGSDMFLVAPRREACGQSQMRAMRYGAVPIVHATGGLIDTVRPFSAQIGKGEGFLFREYAGGALLGAVEAALSAYEKRSSWKRLVQHIMRIDHSWARAAQAFEPIYARLLARSSGE